MRFLLSCLLWLVRLFTKPRSKKIIKLQGKVDELTSKLANEMRKHPVNNKRVNKLRSDIKLLNRRIARLRKRD
jgi:peptidoglycan hydrolase CwlO-like protein